jgi:hypothetical protein
LYNVNCVHFELYCAAFKPVKTKPIYSAHNKTYFVTFGISVREKNKKQKKKSSKD